MMKFTILSSAAAVASANKFTKSGSTGGQGLRLSTSKRSHSAGDKELRQKLEKQQAERREAWKKQQEKRHAAEEARKETLNFEQGGYLLRPKNEEGVSQRDEIVADKKKKIEEYTTKTDALLTKYKKGKELDVFNKDAVEADREHAKKVLKGQKVCLEKVLSPWACEEEELVEVTEDNVDDIADKVIKANVERILKYAPKELNAKVDDDLHIHLSEEGTQKVVKEVKDYMGKDAEKWAYSGEQRKTKAHTV